jgi:hypothetical protein
MYKITYDPPVRDGSARMREAEKLSAERHFLRWMYKFERKLRLNKRQFHIHYRESYLSRLTPVLHSSSIVIPTTLTFGEAERVEKLQITDEFIK